MKTNEILNSPDEFRYQMLDRLRADCDYFLSYGNRHNKYLWAGNPAGQIKLMRDIYNSFADDKKPEWLTPAEIDEYERLMVPQMTTEGALT